MERGRDAHLDIIIRREEGSTNFLFFFFCFFFSLALSLSFPCLFLFFSFSFLFFSFLFQTAKGDQEAIVVGVAADRSVHLKLYV